MPKGRPRLTEDQLQARIAAYCERYAVSLTPEGLPPFPAGRRESRQHRDWLAVYKAHNRLARRDRGQCERCSQPASEGSVFCESHRGGVAARAGDHGATQDDRRRLHSAQRGKCPICLEKVGLSDSIDHDQETGAVRGLLHQRCHQLVGLVEIGGEDVLARLRDYLWP